MPPLGDVDKFSTGGYLDWATCSDQVEQCRRWVRHLKQQRRTHGWSDGRYDRWIAETEFHAQVWGLLHNAMQGDVGGTAIWQRKQLAMLREVIGRERYHAGWTPPRLPDLRPPAPKIMPRAGAANANGIIISP